MKNSVLICTKQFVAFNVDYGVGDIIPMDVASRWPEGTVNSRISNGFLELKIIEETPEAVVEETPEAVVEAASSQEEEETQENFSKELPEKQPVE